MIVLKTQCVEGPVQKAVSGRHVLCSNSGQCELDWGAPMAWGWPFLLRLAEARRRRSRQSISGATPNAVPDDLTSPFHQATGARLTLCMSIARADTSASSPTCFSNAGRGIRDADEAGT